MIKLSNVNTVYSFRTFTSLVKKCLYSLSLCLFILSCSDDKEDNPITTVVPNISINDITIERTKNVESVRFYVALDKPSSNEVSFDYVLVDGTAKKDIDYLAGSGTITIPAQQFSTSIEAFIVGNTLRQEDLQFVIQLSNPKGCNFKIPVATCTISSVNGEDIKIDNSGFTSPTTYPGKSLVWSDEFSGNSLNLSDWNQEIGNGASGWGNNELQYYTNSKKNTVVSNGNLIIEARKEPIGGFNYSSARMTTKGKKEFTFGRIDIRAKLPKGKGIWPALWMLGANINTTPWPACGEIDIMELIGSIPNQVHGTLHWEGNSGHVYKGGNTILPMGDFSQEFHVFSILWVEDQIQWLIDDKMFYTLNKSDFGTANYPFNKDHFFIVNLAVGGNWPGTPDVNTSFPQRLFVDYIRVFQ